MPFELLFTPRAEQDLEHQIDYGRASFGAAVAAATLARTQKFLTSTVLAFPRTGLYHAELNVFECWVPGTPFIVFYRLDEDRDAVVILAFFHHAQDRSEFDPGSQL